MKGIADFVSEDASLDINKPIENNNIIINNIDTLIDNNIKKEDDVIEKIVLRKKYEAMYDAYKGGENNCELYNPQWSNDVIKTKIDILKKICSINVDINDKISCAISKGVSYFVETIISKLFIDIKGFSSTFLSIQEVKDIIKQLSVEYLMNITIVNNKMRLLIIAVMTAVQCSVKNKMSSGIKNLLNNMRNQNKDNEKNKVDDERVNNNNILIEEKKPDEKLDEKLDEVN